MIRGDSSYRVIAADVDLTALQIAHRSSAFDVRGIEADKNLALPLDRLKSLARQHIIGIVAPRHFSFMGSTTFGGMKLKASNRSVQSGRADRRYWH